MNFLKKHSKLLVFGSSCCFLLLSPAPAKADTTEKKSNLGSLSSQYSKESKLCKGPFLKEREELKEKIEIARSNGVGVKNYLAAFTYIESMVKNNAEEEEIARRLDALSNSLDEQFKRSKILKIQKLPPPIAASSPPPSLVRKRKKNKFSKLSNSNRGELVNKLKDKWFGGDIPDSIKKKIPAGIDPNKLSKQDIDSLLNRLGK